MLKFICASTSQLCVNRHRTTSKKNTVVRAFLIKLSYPLLHYVWFSYQDWHPFVRGCTHQWSGKCYLSLSLHLPFWQLKRCQYVLEISVWSWSKPLTLHCISPALVGWQVWFNFRHSISASTEIIVENSNAVSRTWLLCIVHLPLRFAPCPLSIYPRPLL